MRDNQAVKMEKDEDFNDHDSHTGIANSKLGGDKILPSEDFCYSQTNLFNLVRTGPKPHKKGYCDLETAGFSLLRLSLRTFQILQCNCQANKYLGLK